MAVVVCACVLEAGGWERRPRSSSFRWSGKELRGADPGEQQVAGEVERCSGIGRAADGDAGSKDSWPSAGFWVRRTGC